MVKVEDLKPYENNPRFNDDAVEYVAKSIKEFGFNDPIGVWQDEINVRNFIQTNYKEYCGNDEFLAKATERTEGLNKKLQSLFALERQFGGVLDIDTATVSSLTSYSPGYIDKENELIFGMQTNRPLKRGVNPFGGMRMVRQACEAYGYELSDKVEQEFKFRTTHNDGVFRAYTDEMRAARKCHVITGLPDAYGRGRIIGDYRRVALYGVDALIEEKKEELDVLNVDEFTEKVIREREEISDQIKALNDLKKMAESYGYDISKPATNAKEAIQWVYFGYLGAVKDQNGAAMSLGRVATLAAAYLRGKHKPTYTPHIDCGDNIIIINAEKVNLTGNKLDDKIYYDHSRYVGGLRERTAKEMRENYPVEMLERAVEGMLPHNRLGRATAKKLFV